MKYRVSLACTVDAYVIVNVTAKSKEELTEAIRKLIAERGPDKPFKVEWSSADFHRVVWADKVDGSEALTPDELKAINDEAQPNESQPQQ